MSDNKRDTIFNILKRADDEKASYAYEIYSTGLGKQTPIFMRTLGSKTFKADYDTSVKSAKSAGLQLRVIVFKGKSSRAGEIGDYLINVSEHTEQVYTANDVQAMIAERLKTEQAKAPTPAELALQTLTGNLQGVDGLGFMGQLSLAERNIDKLELERKHEQFLAKYKYDSLQEKYDNLKIEKDKLENKLSHSENTTLGLVAKNTENEDIIASNATNQLLSRVAVGVVTNIGSRLLTGSPKIASLLGVTPEELGQALGAFNGEAQSQSPIDAPMVDIAAIEDTPRSRKMDSVVQLISELANIDFEQIVYILGYCLQSLEIREEVTQLIKNKTNT